MRKINKHIIHCSDTPKSMSVGAKEINIWHKQRGFSMIGYHYVIRRDGTIESGRMESQIGAHAKGYNSRSIGTCLIGRGEYTKKQFEALKRLSKDLESRYEGLIHRGHYDYSNKSCPMFDVNEFFNTEEL